MIPAKRILAALLALLATPAAKGQQSLINPTISNTDRPCCTGCYLRTQTQFPGGSDSLNHFLSRVLVYPDSALVNNIEGRVYVRFTVRASGEVQEPEIIKSTNSVFNPAVLDLVKRMPPWIPATDSIGACPVHFTLPIHFNLY